VIVIEQGEVNTFALTLTEKVTISDPFYLMVLEGKSGQETIKWLMTDVSAYPERYNKFVFEEGVTATIPFKGDYVYKVYQKAVANTTIPTDPDDLLEQGILRLEGTDATTIEHEANLTTVIYEAD
jgi:hypothetical protein